MAMKQGLLGTPGGMNKGPAGTLVTAKGMNKGPAGVPKPTGLNKGPMSAKAAQQTKGVSAATAAPNWYSTQYSKSVVGPKAGPKAKASKKAAAKPATQTKPADPADTQVNYQEYTSPGVAELPTVNDPDVYPPSGMSKHAYSVQWK